MGIRNSHEQLRALAIRLFFACAALSTTTAAIAANDSPIDPLSCGCLIAPPPGERPCGRDFVTAGSAVLQIREPKL